MRIHKYQYGFYFCLLLLGNIYNAYPQFPITEDISHQEYFLSLNSQLDVNSTGLTNHFVSSIYKGKYISDNLKKNTESFLNTNYNLSGYQFNTSVFLNIPGNKYDINYFIGFENHNFLELTFNKYLFQLVLYGNKDFAGKYVPLGNFLYKNLNFQQLKAGFYKTWRGQDAIQRIMGGLGYCNGQSLMQFSLPKANFFTHPNAEELTLDMYLEMKRSDTLDSRFGAENGSGICLDAGYFYQDKSNVFELRLNNFGFIRWNRKSHSYIKDTLINFEGFEIQNIFIIDSSTLAGLGIDTILNEYAYAKATAPFTEMIPMSFSFTYKRYFLRNLLSLTLHYNQYFFLRNNPLVKISPALHLPCKSSFVTVYADFQYGGYGRFNCGLGVSARINKGFYFDIRSSYINSYLSPKNSAGLGAYVSLIKTL